MTIVQQQPSTVRRLSASAQAAYQKRKLLGFLQHHPRCWWVFVLINYPPGAINRMMVVVECPRMRDEPKPRWLIVCFLFHNNQLINDCCFPEVMGDFVGICSQRGERLRFKGPLLLFGVVSCATFLIDWDGIDSRFAGNYSLFHCYEYKTIHNRSKCDDLGCELTKNVGKNRDLPIWDDYSDDILKHTWSKKNCEFCPV